MTCWPFSKVLGQDVMPPVGCWEQLQIAFPAVKQRLVPLAEPKGRLGYPLPPFRPPLSPPPFMRLNFGKFQELSEIGAGRNAEWILGTGRIRVVRNSWRFLDSVWNVQSLGKAFDLYFLGS